MSALNIQRMLAGVFLGLGGWALIFPGTVEQLVFKPNYFVGNETSRLLLACFGAQAVLAGTIMALARFTPTTFLVFGLVGSIPFFIFNYYFVFVVEMFTHWMLLDFVGNVSIFALCMYGYWKSLQEVRRSHSH